MGGAAHHLAHHATATAPQLTHNSSPPGRRRPSMKITLSNPLPPSTRSTLQTVGLSLVTLAVTGVGQALTDVAREQISYRLAPKRREEPGAAPQAWVRPEDLPVYIYGLVDPRTS